MTVSGTVMWYVHDQGRGHLQRARAVIPTLDSPVIVACGPHVSPLAADVLTVPVVPLPCDVPPRPIATRGPFHHAPTSPEVRARAVALVDAIRTHRCTTAVVDVSMEVVVLARLLGLRVIALRQSGRRDDAAHHVGFDSADVVWVPQCRSLEPIDVPVDRRWRFTGAFSRFDALPAPPPTRGEARRRRLVVLMVGRGGNGLDVARWMAAAAPSGWRVVVAGTAERASGRGVEIVGCVDPVFPLLADADVVVTSAGWSAVADAVAARSRLVLVAEDRPFAEQEVRARALAEAGLAISRAEWPTPEQLPGVLEEAGRLDLDRWTDHYDRRGSQRAATMIDELHAS